MFAGSVECGPNPTIGDKHAQGMISPVGTTWSGLATACAAIFVSIVLAILSARREAYKRVLDALDFMASSAVDDARHQMGVIVNLKDAPGNFPAAAATAGTDV